MADKNRNLIGYRRPPRHTQFRPGASGNPSGRPRGRRNFLTELRDELSAPTTVVENGAPLTISKQRAVVRQLVAAAVGGDLRAATTVLALCMRLAIDDVDEERPPAFDALAELEEETGNGDSTQPATAGLKQE